MRCSWLLLTAVAALVPSAHSYYYYPCGRYYRYCGIYAYCYYGQCRCVFGYEGCPLVECHEPEEFQCAMKADPHFVGFARPMADLNWPCRYRMTRVQHPLEGGTPGLAFCSVEVFGFNEVVNGRFFTSGVEVALALGDFANQVFSQIDLIKFDVNQFGVASSDGNVTQWGVTHYVTIHGVEVECSFDPYYHFATLAVPRCGLRVRFRPFDETHPSGPQPMVPAISIVVSNRTVFGATHLGTYPGSLCGQTTLQGDDEDLYRDRVAVLGVANRNQALLFDALDQSLPQTSLLPNVTSQVLQRAASCQVSVDTFALCSPQAKVKAVRTCSAVLKRLAGCLGGDVIRAFNACVRAVCVDVGGGCGEYKALLTAGGCEKGPRAVRRLCKGVSPPPMP